MHFRSPCKAVTACRVCWVKAYQPSASKQRQVVWIKLLLSMLALDTGQDSSHECHGFLMEVFPSLAVQVGINMCYRFYSVWNIQPFRHAVHCTQGPSSLTNCQDGKVKLLHLKLLFLDLSRSSAPKTAHTAPKKHLMLLTASPFSSYVPADALNPSHPSGPKRRTLLGEQQAKDILQHQVHTACPTPSPITGAANVHCGANHNLFLSLCTTCPLLQTAVIYSKTVLKSSSEKSSTISKAVIFFISLFFFSIIRLQNCWGFFFPLHF